MSIIFKQEGLLDLLERRLAPAGEAGPERRNCIHYVREEHGADGQDGPGEKVSLICGCPGRRSASEDVAEIPTYDLIA